MDALQEADRRPFFPVASGSPSGKWANVFVSCEGKDVIVWLRGEHDMSTRESLSAVFADAMTVGSGDVIADLRSVEFLCAATIGVLVEARVDARARRRSLRVRAPSPRAFRVLDLCGLLDVLGSSSVPERGIESGGSRRSWDLGCGAGGASRCSPGPESCVALLPLRAGDASTSGGQAPVGAQRTGLGCGSR